MRFLDTRRNRDGNRALGRARYLYIPNCKVRFYNLLYIMRSGMERVP